MPEENKVICYTDALLELLEELSVFKDGFLIGEIGNKEVYIKHLIDHYGQLNCEIKQILLMKAIVDAIQGLDFAEEKPPFLIRITHKCGAIVL